MGNNVSFSYTQKTGASKITAADEQYIRTSSEVKGESENVCCDNEFIASGKKEEYNKISMSSDSNKSHDVSMQDNNLEGATAYIRDHSSVLLENMEQNHSESGQGFKTKSQTCENIKPNLDTISSATAISKQTVCLQLPSKPVVKATPLCLPSLQKDTKSKSATVPVKSKKSVKQLDFNNHVTDGQPSEIVVFSNNVQEEVSNEALLELADLQLKNRNQHEAKTNIAHILTRLDQEFNLMRTSQRVDQSKAMLDDHSKKIGKQYKMCSLLLMKLPDSVLDAMRCLYTGLVYYGNPDLYEYEKISSDVWIRFQEEVVNNFKAAYQEMADLVFICNDLYERNTRIILFMAFELATKFVKLMSKLPEDSKLNIYTLISRLWFICARCHYIVKEFIKAQEVLNLLCKDQRQCNNIDVLELWAFCLLHTEKYTLAKQKVELAIKVARTEEQKSRFQKLEEHLIQKIQQDF
ncbi:uncharacterized protein LOC127726987 [Mytilus californianus]|uniref:uncharacterized protein LOC127726987 n=1 Tax=Mytilus californianus TaxID=6549 RepID=UPI0022485C2F|nr:uncharacterized protein LOC127726987 [Mytilus californianus]